MSNQTSSAATRKSNGGSSALNIGIGMLLGLIVALVVAFFAMSGGPFRDKSNKNVLTDSQQGNTDPNAPLYTKTNTPPTLPDNFAPTNEQGAGAGALTGAGSSTSTGVNNDVNSALAGNQNANANNSMADGQTTQPKKAPNDAIAELIVNKDANKAPTTGAGSANKTKAPVATPKTTSPSKTPTTAPSAAASPSKAPISAPKSSGSAPKAVTPVTATNANVR